MARTAPDDPGPWGDPTRHLDPDELRSGYARLPAPPTDEGALRDIWVRRPAGEREQLEEAVVTPDGGVLGDRWAGGPRDRSTQITVMRHDVGRLIANGQSMGLFGDQLMVDLDLGVDNLPLGSRLQIGDSVVVEITPKPHTGCKRYSQRFGLAALRMTNQPDNRDARLRGIHVHVVSEGVIRREDAIRVLR